MSKKNFVFLPGVPPARLADVLEQFYEEGYQLVENKPIVDDFFAGNDLTFVHQSYLTKMKERFGSDEDSVSRGLILEISEIICKKLESQDLVGVLSKRIADELKNKPRRVLKK